MAFNNLYNPYMYGGYQMQQPQQQSSGFVSVNNIQEAYNWPVAPGNSITFKDENAPYVYTKTKGTSPLDQPVFERYRLVKEDDMPHSAPERPKSGVNYEEQINMLWDEINALKDRITAKEDKPKRQQKREVVDDAKSIE